MRLIERIRNLIQGVKVMSETGPVVKQEAVSGVPDLAALLQPGIGARRAPALLPLPAKPEIVEQPAISPEPVKPERVSQTPQCAKHAEPLVCRSCFEEEKASAATAEQRESVRPAIGELDTDYDNVQLPPRSPEMIAALIAAGETEEQRGRRRHNDIARFHRQRGL
jgi:hypothetical protein